MKKVELRQAYRFDCEECGKVNFLIPEGVELTREEEEADFREMYGYGEFDELPPNWQACEHFAVPKNVVCEQCAEVYEIEDEPIDDFEDEDEETC